MSVRGEFQRVLAECLALLETSSASDREEVVTWLARASERANDDLGEAAQMVLHADAGESAKAPRFEHVGELQAFEKSREHLRAICRAIVGR